MPVSESNLTKPSSMENEQYNAEDIKDLCGDIIDTLDDEKSVLILGNQVFSKPSEEEKGKEVSPFEMLMRNLPEELKQKLIEWAADPSKGPKPDIYTLAQSYLNKKGAIGKKTKLLNWTKIKIEDLQEKQLDRFRKISEIPFDLIISTYPFDLLDEVFTANQIDHEFDFYNFLGGRDEPPVPSSEKPLIYNLFGSFKHKESMVISLDRLYKFIFEVLGLRQLPFTIKKKISDADHLVFIGFSFDDWYMKLILRLFEVHNKENSFANLNKSGNLMDNNRQFFSDNFKITFLEQDVDIFIDGLHAQCIEDDKLRKKNLHKNSMYQELNEWLIESKFKNVLNKLDQILREKEHPLLKKQMDYHKELLRLEKRKVNFSNEEYDTRMKKFRDKLSPFIDEVRIAVA